MARTGGGGRGGRSNSPILVFDPATGASSSNAGSSSSGASTGTKPLGAGKGGSGSGGATKGGSSGSSGSSYSSYLAAQKAEQRKRDRAAAERYTQDAANMQGQVDALRHALGSSFRDALDTKLANLDVLTGQQLQQVRQGFDERAASLDADSATNKKAMGDAVGQTDSNRARERASALAELANQGGGESDSLTAQLMSLRSGNANLTEAARSFFDSERSINSARVDLGNDTRTALANVYSEAEADRAQLWNDYYGQRAESQTQLGNTLGQQAEYYGMAAEQGGVRNGVVSGSIVRSNQIGRGGRGGRVLGGPGKASGGPVKGSPFIGDGQPLGRPAMRTPAQGGSGSGLKLDQSVKGGKDKGPKKLGPKVSSLAAQEEAARESDKAFLAAAKLMGKAYESDGIPDEILNFKGPKQEKTEFSGSLLQGARTTIATKAPEGATLRKW